MCSVCVCLHTKARGRSYKPYESSLFNFCMLADQSISFNRSCIVMIDHVQFLSIIIDHLYLSLIIDHLSGRRAYGHTGRRTYQNIGRRTYRNIGRRAYGHTGRRTYENIERRTYRNIGRRTYENTRSCRRQSHLVPRWRKYQSKSL